LHPDVPIDSKVVRELLRLAKTERRAGNQTAEFAYLAQIIEHDNAHSRAHSRLAEMTGLAPAAPIPRSDDLVIRAQRYPYDPRALVAGAESLLQRGHNDQAVEYLERAVWLADIDPSAALIAIRRLQVLSDEWKRQRIVPVHVYADELIRLQPGWQFEIRTLWLSASSALDSVLETRFVPIAILPFDSGDTPNDLDSIHAAFLAKTRPPAEGIFAAITGRPVPSGDEIYRKGVAEFLGRSLAVRVAPGASQSRILAHEILHLYGAIHVLDDVDSLMNQRAPLDRPRRDSGRLPRCAERKPHSPRNRNQRSDSRDRHFTGSVCVSRPAGHTAGHTSRGRGSVGGCFDARRWTTGRGDSSVRSLESTLWAVDVARADIRREGEDTEGVDGIRHRS